MSVKFSMAEYTELCAMLGELNVRIDQLKESAVTAEADRDRYKAALERIAHSCQHVLSLGPEDIGGTPDRRRFEITIGAALDVARAALEAKR